MDGIEALSTGAFILRRSHFLVLVRTQNQSFMPGMGDLPGGFVMSGEDLISSLLREVKEETGLHVINISSYLGYFDFDSARGRRTRQLNFTVECESGRIRLSRDEHQAYKWIHIDDDKELDLLGVSAEVKDIVYRLRDTL